jgi:hypothetical protein
MDDRKFKRSMNLGMAGCALLVITTAWVFLSPVFEREILDHFAAMVGIIGFLLLVVAALQAS